MKEKYEAALGEISDAIEEYCLVVNKEMYSKLEKAQDTIMQLIENHFDNPPLSFDDLEVGEAYWDNLRECWFIVTEYDPTGYYQEKEICWYFDKNGACYLENISKNEFDENRYYKKKVKE